MQLVAESSAPEFQLTDGSFLGAAANPIAGGIQNCRSEPGWVISSNARGVFSNQSRSTSLKSRTDCNEVFSGFNILFTEVSVLAWSQIVVRIPVSLQMVTVS